MPIPLGAPIVQVNTWALIKRQTNKRRSTKNCELAAFGGMVGTAHRVRLASLVAIDGTVARLLVWSECFAIRTN